MIVDLTTLNTILLSLVMLLVTGLGKIFWSGIKDFRAEMKLMGETMGKTELSVTRIDEWRKGKDKIDEMRHDENKRRLEDLEDVNPRGKRST